MNIWHIDSSGRHEGSHSRELTKLLAGKLAEKNDAEIIYRDVGKGLPFVDDKIISGLFVPGESRTEEQKDALKPSDEVIKEALESDIWVLGIPIYNFSMPAAFKAWADMLARARVTFKYSENGPVGLLENKKVYAVITSGGTEVGSEIDFLTPWLKHFLKFVGITDLEIIRADKINDKKKSSVIENFRNI